MHSLETERNATARSLRELIAAERYTEAPAPLLQYRLVFEAALRQLPQGDARLHQWALEARGLLDQLRRQVLARRSHMAADLAALSRAQGYGAPRRGGRIVEYTG